VILGFKDQFVPYVREGSKTHSVRSGGRWKVGMRADLFEKVRQKGMSLIFRAPVVKVEPVFIWEIRDQHIDGWPRWNLCPLHKRTMIRIGFPEKCPTQRRRVELIRLARRIPARRLNPRRGWRSTPATVRGRLLQADGEVLGTAASLREECP